jgi:hypothetical protein
VFGFFDSLVTPPPSRKSLENARDMDVKNFMQMLDKQLHELLEKHLALYGNHDPQHRPKAQEFAKDKAFIAWCLLHLPDYPDMEIQEALEAIVDGAGEKGIDAIYVPERGKRLLVMQTKRRRDPKGAGVKKNDLVLLFNGVEWLLDGDLANIQNVGLKARAEEFRDAYQSFDYEGVKIVYATTAEHGLSREAQDEIDAALARFRKRGTRFDIEILTLENLRQMFISQVHQPFSLTINLKLKGQPYIYEGTSARALIGTVAGVELAQLYDEHQHRVLAANIRSFLGNVKINNGIQATAGDPTEASNFWFYNNGVTFVCDEFGFRSLTDTTVKLENAQIINGAQTISSLWRVWRESQASQAPIHDVDVIIRIIERRGDIDFRRKVTLFTNSQNAVLQSDLVGTDTIQIELKRRLLDMGYYYEIRRGDYRAERVELEKKGLFIQDVFTLKLAAQALAAFFEQIPAIAKSQTSKLFLSQEDGGYYDRLFEPKTEPLHLALAVTTLRRIGEIRKLISGKKVEIPDSDVKAWLPEGYNNLPVWLPHADYFLAALIAYRFFNPNFRYDLEYLKQFKEWVESGEESFKEDYAYLIERIGEVVRGKEQEYGYSHPKFFKSQSEYYGLCKKVGVNYRTF